jgi:hypothetical protein
MSIRDCLRDRVAEQRMYEVLPILPSSKPRPRSVWVEAFVFEQLDPTTASVKYALESGRMRRKLENIGSDRRMVVGNRSDKHCDLKRLEPFANEVWEIRERNHPSIRIFFRFIERDCLAGTNVRFVSELFAVTWLRKGVATWPVWRTEIRRCKAVWRSLFSTYPPHTGATLNDYLSNAVGSGSF